MEAVYFSETPVPFHNNSWLYAVRSAMLFVLQRKFSSQVNKRHVNANQQSMHLE
jgi:hypothetical protein